MNQEILACSGPGLDDLNEFYENNPHGEALNAILLDELNVLPIRIHTPPHGTAVTGLVPDTVVLLFGPPGSSERDGRPQLRDSSMIDLDAPVENRG